MITTDSDKLKDLANNFSLEAADILLIHTKKSLWGWLIRRGTHSYWNHALMVYSPGSPENCYGDTLVIDAKTGGTIEMDCLRKYIEREDKYDVAIKRLEVNRSQDNKQLYNSNFRNRICNIAANEVVVKSSSKSIELMNQAIRQITIILRFLKRKLYRSRKTPHLSWDIRPVQLKAFTCGGFVQWCYYKGIYQLTKERVLSKSKPEDVVFNPRAKKKVTPYELLTTTPADLANCSKLSWKYIIKNGLIREVSGNREVALHYGVI